MSIVSVWYYVITVEPRKLELPANSYKVRFPFDLPPQFYSDNSWIPRIPRLLELNSLSLDQNFTEIYPANSNSGSCNSTRMPLLVA